MRSFSCPNHERFQACRIIYIKLCTHLACMHLGKGDNSCAAPHAFLGNELEKRLENGGPNPTLRRSKYLAIRTV